MMMDKPSAAWRRLLLPLGALLLSGLLLFTGLSALRAQAADKAAPQESDLLAPLQQAYNFNITVEARPNNQFQVQATNNRYVINVIGDPFPTGTDLPSINVFAELPLGITWTPANSGRWNCFAVTTQIDCDYRGPVTTTIDALSVAVNVAADVGVRAEMTAQLNVTARDPKNVTIVTPINSAELEFSKTVSPVTGVVGQEILYTLVITNNGPNTVTSFIVEDLDLPDHLSFLDYNGPIPGPYDPLTGQWTYTAGPSGLLEGQEVSVVLPFTVTEGAPTQINNTARIISSQGPYGARGDWVTSNNSDNASVVIGGLEVNKTVTTPNGTSPPATDLTVTVGQPIEVAIAVTNPSPTVAVSGGFTITEDIPVGLDLRQPLPSGSRFDSTTRVLTFRRTSLVGGETFTYRFTMVGSSSLDFEEQFTNVATVSWGSPQARVDSNEVTFTVIPGGALYVTKTDNLSQVYVGAVYSYTITVTNTGNVQVNQVVLTDTMGSYLYATGVVLGGIGNGNCSSHTFCRITLNNSLSPGAKASFRVGVRVLSGAPAGSNVVNTVLATGRDDETGALVSSTASDSNLVLETPATSLRITKDVTPIEANVGGTLTFRIDVRNNGGNTVTNVIITDEFVAGLDLVSATTTRGTATLNTGARTLEVNIGSLGAGDRASIVVTTRVNSTVTVAQVYRNSAYVSWSPGAGEDRSNIVPFRLLPGSALPGTGLTLSSPGGPNPGSPSAELFAPPVSDPAQGAAGSFISGALGLLALGLGLLAILLLAYGMWARINRPLYAGRAARTSLALIVLALVCGIGAVLLRPSQAPPAQLASLAGNKPPLATAAPTEIPLPSPTRRLPAPAQEQEPPADAGQPMLESRPTDSAPAPTLEPLPTELAHLQPTPTPSVLPDFPIPTPTAMPSTGPDGGPPDASAVRRIVIPAINLDTVVKYVPFSGYTWLISGLKQEVAWMGDTSWPGLGGNTGLAGHVDLVDGSAGPFWDLKLLKAGDQITLYTQQKVYTYRVREQRVVSDTDMSVIAATANPQLTLITCTDWSTELRTYLQRLVVFAEFVQVQAQ
jgi:LPXTG-site transpeptidase (sortase) family protein